MAFSFKRFFEGIRIIPKTTSTVDSAGELDFDTTNDKLNLHNGTTASPVVTESHTATLTNKTFDANGTGNSISNLEVADFAAGVIDTDINAVSASDNTLPTAKAVKAYVDQQILTEDAASEIAFTPAGTIAATDVQAAIEEVASDASTDLSTHIADASDAHAASAITNTPSGNLSATTVQAALNELQIDVDTRATNANLGILDDSVTQLATDLSTHASDTTNIHGIADTADLLTTTNSKVVTNKDLDGGTASNASRITIPKNTKANLDGLTRKEATIVWATDEQTAYVDDGSALVAIGSGAGSGFGDINYVTNHSAETDTSGWTTYADGIQYYNGTGGSPVATWTRGTGSSLDGVNENYFIYTPGATANDGVSYEIDIGPGYWGTILEVSFLYQILTYGSYNDGDLKVIVYDPLTGEQLSVVGTNILRVGGASKHTARFQCPFGGSFSGELRISIHQTTTNTSYSSVRFSRVSVSPQNTVRGPMISDWQAWTPTGTWNTTSTYTGFWRQVGDTREYKVKIALSGAATAASLGISLPSGHTIDTSKLAQTAAGTGSLGTGHAVDTGSAFYPLTVGYNTTTAVSVYAILASNTYGVSSNVGASIPFTFASGDAIDVSFKLPIVGLSSSQVLSSEEDGRVCSFTGARSASQAVTSGVTNITLDMSKDTHGGWATNIYTVKVAGDYHASISGIVSTAATLHIYKNGTLFAYCSTAGSASFISSGSALIPNCVAGDTISFRSGTTANLTWVNGSIHRLSGPAQIAASETVAAVYSTAAGQSIGNGTWPIVDFGSRVEDSHGSVTTGASWKFTAPMAGVYSVSAMATWPSGNYTSASSFIIGVYKNGVFVRGVSYVTDNSTQNMYPSVNGSTLVRLNAGDYIDIRIYQDTGAAAALHNNANYNHVSIHRVGN